MFVRKKDFNAADSEEKHKGNGYDYAILFHNIWGWYQPLVIWFSKCHRYTLSDPRETGRGTGWCEQNGSSELVSDEFCKFNGNVTAGGLFTPVKFWKWSTKKKFVSRQQRHKKVYIISLKERLQCRWFIKKFKENDHDCAILS